MVRTREAPTGHEALVRELASGTLFGAPGSIEIRETHASLVFLTPSEVFKLKKPVDFGFLNYSTLRRRGRMCRQEVVLNQRLAPDVYLGVERLTQGAGGHLQLSGRGRVVDYLVRMRRLRDEDALDARLRAGGAAADDVRRVGECIGRFHVTLDPAPRAFGPTSFLRNARDNLVALRSSTSGFPEAVLAELEAYST